MEVSHEATWPGNSEKRCGPCRANTRFLDHTLFGRRGFVIPAEIWRCPQCDSVSISVVDDSVVQGPAFENGLAFRAKRMRVEKHRDILEVMCPRCGASMFPVQHSDVNFGGADILAES